MSAGTPPNDAPGTTTGEPVPVEVRRSRRRRRTVSAYRDGGRVVVLIPATFTAREEREWVERMVARLDRRRGGGRSDADLLARAGRLSRRHLGGRARPVSVTWVDNQRARWGSCTPADGTIRLSSRLRAMPEFVVDYVLMHELAHLLEPSHAPRFWALLEDVPHLDRARGYLEGWSDATGRSAAPDDSPDDSRNDSRNDSRDDTPDDSPDDSRNDSRNDSRDDTPD